MNIDSTWETDCASLEQSLALAERLGSLLKGGEVIELVSDIGGGKTTFVKGIAKGMGSTDYVTSPTFTLNNVYQGDGLSLHHYDFYRLAEAGILHEELAETLHDPTAVSVIEWAEVVHDVLPEERLTIKIVTTGEESRHYECTASGDAARLQEAFTA